MFKLIEMFPIRRPCTDVIRTGYSVLWGSSSHATRRILRSSSSTAADPLSSQSPPSLTAVLREPPSIPSIKFASPKVKPAANTPNQTESNGKPNSDQLQRTYNILQSSLEKTFTHPMDYSIYHPEVLFIDNIRHIRTQGLAKYIQQVALLKTVGHVKFAYVRFEIMQMSMNTEQAVITVRWRIKGLSGIRVMLKFWKYKLWRWQEIMNHQETWYDGISYFSVNSEAKIVQHVADKVMEDKDPSADLKGPGTGLPFAAKLGGALGATAFPSASLNCDSEGADSGGGSKNN